MAARKSSIPTAYAKKKPSSSTPAVPMKNPDGRGKGLSEKRGSEDVCESIERDDSFLDEGRTAFSTGIDQMQSPLEQTREVAHAGDDSNELFLKLFCEALYGVVEKKVSKNHIQNPASGSGGNAQNNPFEEYPAESVFNESIAHADGGIEPENNRCPTRVLLAFATRTNLAYLGFVVVMVCIGLWMHSRQSVADPIIIPITQPFGTTIHAQEILPLAATRSKYIVNAIFQSLTFTRSSILAIPYVGPVVYGMLQFLPAVLAIALQWNGRRAWGWERMVVGVLEIYVVLAGLAEVWDCL